MHATSILSTSWIVSVNLMGVTSAGDDIERSDNSIILLFCTHLNFDLILSFRSIFRLGIHPYRVYYTYIKIISMDASFYSILPSKVKIKVSNGAKIRNRYNQVPHLTQDTNGKVTNSQKTPQTRAKRSALSQQVTTKHI